MDTATNFGLAPRSCSMAAVKPLVFVVDDDISLRDSLGFLIANAGWRPELFASAMEFLASPRPPSPSCLVLDVGLPDLDGLELQQRIASERADMPIIFITARGDIPMTVRAMKAGAVEFLAETLYARGAFARHRKRSGTQPYVPRGRGEPAGAS